MSRLHFSIQHEPRNANEEYVMMQAGKGKDPKDKLFILRQEFSYIEGLIWDKFREYDSIRKVKIPTPEWTRIIEGFQIAMEKLLNTTDAGEIEKILKFEIINPKFPIADVVDHIDEMITLLQELIVWLQQVTQHEKFIVITRYKP